MYVPTFSGFNLYRKPPNGNIEHCVTIGTPSIWAKFFCRNPCQWKDNSSDPNLLYKRISIVSPIHT